VQTNLILALLCKADDRFCDHEKFNRKEVHIMTNYMKPRIVSTVEASIAVLSPEKLENYADNPNIGSPSAYEADE